MQGSILQSANRNPTTNQLSSLARSEELPCSANSPARAHLHWQVPQLQVHRQWNRQSRRALQLRAHLCQQVLQDNGHQPNQDHLHVHLHQFEGGEEVRGSAAPAGLAGPRVVGAELEEESVPVHPRVVLVRVHLDEGLEEVQLGGENS